MDDGTMWIAFVRDKLFETKQEGGEVHSDVVFEMRDIVGKLVDDVFAQLDTLVDADLGKQWWDEPDEDPKWKLLGPRFLWMRLYKNMGSRSEKGGGRRKNNN